MPVCPSNHDTAAIPPQHGEPCLPDGERQASPPSSGLRRLSLKRNFSWTLTGNVVYSGCQWATLILIARLGDPETVGRYSLGLAIAAPIIMFANLQLRSVQATDARERFAFADYLGVRLLTTTLALLIIAGIVLAVPRYHGQVGWIILAVGLAKAVESISDVYYGLFQQHERMDRVAISLILKGPLSLLGLGLCFYLSRDILWGALGLAAVWTVLLLGYDVWNGSRILHALGRRVPRPRWNPRTILPLVRLTLPLGLVMLGISLNTNIPRYFIEGYLGERSLGFFAVMISLVTAGTMIVRALAQSAMPRLARHYANGEIGAYRRLLTRLTVIGLLLGGAGIVVMFFAGRPLLAGLFGAEYARYSREFIVLMFCAAAMYLTGFFGVAVTAMRRFTIQTVFYGANLLVAVLTAAWLIPRYGLLGACWSVTVSAVLLMGCYWVTAYRMDKPAAAPEQDRWKDHRENRQDDATEDSLV